MYSGTSITRIFKGRENVFRTSEGFQLSRKIFVAKCVKGNEEQFDLMGDSS